MNGSADVAMLARMLRPDAGARPPAVVLGAFGFRVYEGAALVVDAGDASAMNDFITPDPHTHGSEPLDEGGTWLLDLVSAVDHLRRGYRPGFTVWDALAEAIDRAAETITDGDSTADNLLGALIFRHGGHPALQRAIRVWVLVMAERYNASHHWPHPAARLAFPPPLLDAEWPTRTSR